MFTGFATENTPAIQVWDFQNTYASTSATRRISLTDDCAPIQYIKTGGSATAFIAVYLPSCAIEGKQIKIINARYGNALQYLYLYSSESSWAFGSGTENIIYVIGPGQTLDLCYSKNFISFGPTAGQYASGWISLNQAPSGAANFYSSCNAFSSAASGSQSAVLGGQSNISSAGFSAVVGGSSNTASGQNSFIGSGGSHTASGTNTGILGGQSNTASAAYASVIGGISCVASASYASVVGASSGTANGLGSIVIGGENATARSIQGNFVVPASLSPVAGASGRQQTAYLLLGRETTDATATILTSNTSAASTTNQVILPNNSAYYVRGSIIATVTGGGNTKSWDFIATIKRGATAASTAIVGAVTLNVQAADAGAATWVVAITADTTNGGLAVTVTGQTATTIRWVAKLESTEVTY